MEEAQEYADWYNVFPEHPVDIPELIATSEAALRKKLLDRIKDKNRQNDARLSVYQMPSRRLRWLGYAAAVLLFFVVGGFLFLHNKAPVEVILARADVDSTDFSPGGNKAILTLSNGFKIDLNEAKKGALGSQGSSKIVKVAEGMVNYANGQPEVVNSQYNTMATPRGGQYRLQLSDGTLVWLNAASSITFPVSFAGDSRRVSITGEVYFEVAKNALKPFIVSIDDQTEVIVLGTQFNISAYHDEPVMNTTLVEGSIRIRSANSSERLAAGQQASIGKNAAMKILNNTNIEEVLAWKNGSFYFDGASLDAVMRQLSRWYDTEVVFEGEVPDKQFVGNISRDIKASGVLKMLEFAGVEFRIEDRKIIVMSK